MHNLSFSKMNIQIKMDVEKSEIEIINNNSNNNLVTKENTMHQVINNNHHVNMDWFENVLYLKKNEKECRSSVHPTEKISTFAQLVRQVEYFSDCKKMGIVLKSYEQILLNMSPAIYELHSLVGQIDLKNELCRLILYCAQNLYQNDSHMRNICIFAPPGSGKSRLTKIIASVFYYSGLLGKSESNKEIHYIEGNRSNLIAPFVGQTAPMTQKIINQCIEEKKCLIIDEIYSLGSGHNSSKQSNFDSECISTICGNLTLHPNSFRLIIAGYKEKTLELFFNGNEGLLRRFRFFELAKYNASELREIFLQQLSYSYWDIESPYQTATKNWFKINQEKFYFSAGDIEIIIGFAKEYAAQRNQNRPTFLKTRLNQEDIDAALNLLMKSRTEQYGCFSYSKSIYSTMYG